MGRLRNLCIFSSFFLLVSPLIQPFRWTDDGVGWNMFEAIFCTKCVEVVANDHI